MLVNCSICLTDIPRDRIKVAANGKKYLNVTLQDLREADEYGHTHSLFCSQTKEEREAKEKRVYIGRGREVVFNQRTPSAEEIAALPTASDFEDLPF